MKKRTSLAGLILALGLTVLSACGGGGSGEMQGPPRTGTAVLKIETTGVLAQGTMIGGIVVTGVLPSGVTVKATPDVQNHSVLVTDSGVVAASGVTKANASAFATYDPATGKVSILVYDQDGFGIGEFVTVTCDVASDASPTAGNFGLEGFTPKDLNGAQIDGLTPGYTVDIHDTRSTL